MTKYVSRTPPRTLYERAVKRRKPNESTKERLQESSENGLITMMPESDKIE